MDRDLAPSVPGQEAARTVRTRRQATETAPSNPCACLGTGRPAVRRPGQHRADSDCPDVSRPRRARGAAIPPLALVWITECVRACVVPRCGWAGVRTLVQTDPCPSVRPSVHKSNRARTRTHTRPGPSPGGSPPPDAQDVCARTGARAPKHAKPRRQRAARGRTLGSMSQRW